MQIGQDGFLHLTYCTNIHAADGWQAVSAKVRTCGPALKERLSPTRPFGLGLRLSAREASELLEADRLDEFRAFLDSHGLYVALLNGFPYGPFHGTAVKARVYAPDWRDEARVRYTLDLVNVLRTLLPEGLDGGISTSPLSYKPWMPAPQPADWEAITRNLVRVAATLVRLKQDQGCCIHLDLEPEPDCLIENSHETIDFFDRWLLPMGAPWLADRLEIGIDEARGHLLEHIGICFDCCHFAVEYEQPLAALARLEGAGIRIGRAQLSSALKVSLSDDERAAGASARLGCFADATYLHQVIARRGDHLRHFLDLDLALSDAWARAADEWRVHFHVPLFTAHYDGFSSSQADVRAVVEAAWRTRFTHHLEIETYTWDVLPAELKLDVVDSIEREYIFVLSTLGSLTSARVN